MSRDRLLATSSTSKKQILIGLNDYFSSIDWTNILAPDLCVDATVGSFYEVLTTGFRQFVPLKRKIVKNDPPWNTKRLKNLKNRMSKAHKVYRSTDDMVDRLTFYAIRDEFEKLQQLSYKRFMSKTERDLKADPSKFWSYVNSRKKTSGYPSMMFYADKKAFEPNDVSNLFADFFESVYVPETDGEVRQCPSIVDKRVDIGSIILTYDEIAVYLKDIDTSKGDGPDNISPLLLKNCAEHLSGPLLHIFNLSLSKGEFPMRWKTSHVTPIFKSGSRSNIENYRGVAILPTFGKLFERIISSKLTETFSSIISVHQHGFVKGRSTTTNLVEFVSFATNVVESLVQLDVIYTDFKKAFDRVSHSILIRKLNEMGVHSNLLRWIKSYLSDRSQFVKLSGCSSRTFSVTSGVPQGSHLGPLLFILFMNDATKVFTSSLTYFLYADDLKVCRVVKTVRDAVAMQIDLENFMKWCVDNQLYLNVDKCSVISFTRKRTTIDFEYMLDGVSLKRLQVVRDLGVLMDVKLSFSKHVESIIAKSYSMLGLVMRLCKDFKNVNTLKTIYFAHVRSYLEYASVVWHPYRVTYIDRIESIQKKFLIYALRRTIRRGSDYRLPSYLSRCKLIGIESLARRRINACVFFVFDVLDGRYNTPFITFSVVFNDPTRSLRFHDCLTVDRHRTDYGRYEPINNMCLLFNQFAHLYHAGMSRDVFRAGVKNMSVIIKLNGRLQMT